MTTKHFIKPNEITIRAARINVGLSPADVERETGIRPGWLERIELNCGDITYGTALKLVKLYGRRFDDIFWGRESDYHRLWRERTLTVNTATNGVAVG